MREEPRLGLARALLHRSPNERGRVRSCHPIAARLRLLGSAGVVGWDPGRAARAWAELMRRLGYARYIAQGGDAGAAVTDAMAIHAPDGLAGIHLNFLRRPP